jgi:hypothetical protein
MEEVTLVSEPRLPELLDNSAGFHSRSLIRAKPSIAALRLMAHRGTLNFGAQADAALRLL